MTRPERSGPSAGRGGVRTIAVALFGVACVAGAVSWLASGCDNWDPTEPFERNAPDVDEAIRRMDAGEFDSAQALLTEYLGTGPCSEAGIGLPDSVRQKPNGSFDLGLSLFYLAEKYGNRFGDEDEEPEEPVDEETAARRDVQIECALVVTKAIAADPSVPIDLRARASYLAANLEFMRKRYEEAVRYYDAALALVPGVLEEAGGDEIGRDAAWNRAIALRRIEEQEQDGGEDGGEDADDGSDGSDASDAADEAEQEPDAGDDGGEDASDGSDQSDQDDGGDGGEDAGEDGSDQSDDEGDAGKDSGDPSDDEQPSDPDDQQSPPPDQPQEAPTSPDARQEERILDEFEEAPTYQEEEAKRRRGRGRQTMEDK